MKPIRLLIADIDGTLVTRKKTITERTRQAVERLREAGILFSVTSGRPPRGMATVSKALGLTTPLAAFNGGVIVRPDFEVMVQRTIPLAVAMEVVDYLDASGLDVWVYNAVDWFVRREDVPHLEKERRNVGFDPTIVKDLRAVLEGAVKIVGVSDDKPLIARCEADLQNRVGEFASATRSQTYYLDVTHADANKGTVARLNSLFLRIPHDEIAVIGDMANDVLMFGVAGTSIAMGNASPEVKRAARYITTSNEEEGFANAVDWFIFRQKRAAQATIALPSLTRACLFELDGVLAQTAKAQAEAWKQTLDAFLREQARSTGQPFVPFDADSDFRLHVVGKPAPSGVRAFLASRGIQPPAEVVEELTRRKDELGLELLRAQPVETYDSAVSFVRAVREAGLRTAVVSSSSYSDEVLESSGIADLFDARIDSQVAEREHLAGMPAPDILVAAARALGVDPKQAAVFEGAISGVAAARAGRFGYIVAVDHMGQAEELRSNGADAVISDLAVMMEPP